VRSSIFAVTAGVALAIGLASSRLHAVEIEDMPLQVPIKDAQGRLWSMHGHICRPATHAPVPLAVVNHGSTVNRAEREAMVAEPCDSEIAKWFVEHGFAVAFVLRLGHGKGESPWTESFHCTAAGFREAGLETARQIQAIVDAASRLPNIARDGIVVVGHSAGGWGAIAYDSAPHANVAAVINVSGGRGGHYRYAANSNCHPEQLIEAASGFGKTATIPMLWIYARNDSYFGPALASALNHAFTAAGGAVRFEQTPAFDSEGHALLYGGTAGSAVWGPLVESYLAERHALPDVAATSAR
jgi:dienelactone hydrolase